MGLIKAGIGAIGGTLADQWKEFFYCEAMPSDVLMLKGKKQISGRSSNTKGNDNIISNGSGIAVADGQCMIIVEQGKVVEVCAEPGQFTYDTSSEPSIFSGKLGRSILDTFKTVGRRFAYGGDTGKDQRVYYFNLKEILDNKFGTATPIYFRVVDRNISLDTDVSLRCNGIYSYRIADPLLFYSNVCGNVSDEYRRGEIDTQLKTEFISALQPALAKISELEIRPSALPAHVNELCECMNRELSKKWREVRGIEIVSIAMNPVSLSPDDEKRIKEKQDLASFRDPGLGAAALTQAQAAAMKAAAENKNGAMMGFMGMGMAQAAGGINAQNLYAMAAQQQQQQQAQPAQPAAPAKPAAAAWTCSCGAVNDGKFCMECGKPKPAAAEGWTCSCGAVNKGKFCMECGKPKPAGEPLYRCDKCGWEPADPKHPPKFCPECGDVFDDKDIR